MTEGHYDELEREAVRPKPVRDLSPAWDRLRPLADANDVERLRIEMFFADKRITVAALEQLDTRFTVRQGGRVDLSWATFNGTGTPTAVKYRELGGERRAEAGSVFLEPLIVGRHHSLEWFVAEGETDAARLYELVGDVAAIMVLPAGAKFFEPPWAGIIPRDATVHLCHDADEAGDEGAAKAARLIGGKAVRVRPPGSVKDWCEWDGEREAFVALVAAAREEAEVEHGIRRLLPGDEFILDRPQQIPAVWGGASGSVAWAAEEPLMLYGPDGVGKTSVAQQLVLGRIGLRKHDHGEA